MWLGARARRSLGCALLLFPRAVPGARAQPSPRSRRKVRGYLGGLAFALPPALALHRLSRLQHRRVAAEGGDGAAARRRSRSRCRSTPLLVFGVDAADAVRRAAPAGARRRRLRRRDRDRHVVPARAALLAAAPRPFYRRFGLGRGMRSPRRRAASLRALLRLGVPMGLAMLVEVTGFTFMAFFISRIGATPVAGHQIAVNMVSMMFMLPLAIANATSTLVAQQRRRRRRAPMRAASAGPASRSASASPPSSAAPCLPRCASRWSASTPPTR